MSHQPRGDVPPCTLSELLDQVSADSAMTVKEDHTPLDEVHRRIAAVPQLAPVRGLHALIPRLVARPRDPELADPFLALYRLAECLVTRVEAEFRTDDKWWWMLDRHRGEAGTTIYRLTDSIGLEAKRRAARAWLRADGQQVVDRLVAVTRSLADWRSRPRPEAGSPHSKDHRTAVEEFLRYSADAVGPACEAMELLAEEVHSRETREPEGNRPGSGRGAEPNPTVAAALAIIRGRKGRGISGKELVAALGKKHITITQPGFRRHVVPVLKELGVNNHRARGGYYLDPPA